MDAPAWMVDWGQGRKFLWKNPDNGAHQVRLIMIFLNMLVPARLSVLFKLEFSSCTMKVVDEIRA